MFIRSERLFLRPGWPEDWQELRNRIQEWAVIGGLALPAQPAPASAPARFPQLLVTLPHGNGSRVIGCTGLLCGEHGTELAYWIAPGSCGQGYASEAGRALLSLARTLGHRRMAAVHFAGNVASMRVASKLGFRATGETCRRLCPARGVLASALVYRRDLGEPSDCGSLASAIPSARDRHAA